MSDPLLTDEQALRIKRTLQRNEKNKKCIIFQLAFLDFNGDKCLAGGAERYCRELSNILKNNNFEIILVQMGNSDFWAKEYDGLSIFGIPVLTSADKFSKAIEELECFADVCIYSPFSLVPLNSKSISIGIIHSMFWDDPARLHSSNIDLYSKKLKVCYSVVSNSAVAINWFRGYKGVGYHNFHYIPNFVCLESFKPLTKSTNESDVIHILFPRRITADRGFQYILDVFPKLFKKYENIFLTLGGYVHHDQKNQLQRFLNEFEGKVSHIEAEPREMLGLYQKADIVLIPTLYTEGTSLSCLEAMACGKAIITTNIGGLPELIINRYNGLTINPCNDELYTAIASLIEDPQLRRELGQHAHQVAQAFSLDIWKDKWEKLLKTIPYNPIKKISNKEQVLLDYGNATVIFEKFMPWNFEYIQRFHHIPMALSKLGLSCIFHGFEHQDKLNAKEIRKLQDKLYLTADKTFIEKVRGRVKTVYYFNCYAKDVLNVEYLKNLIQNNHLVIYDYCDHIHEDIFLTEIPKNILESQEYCLKNSSILILASANSLYKHAVKIRGSTVNIFLVPNAANKDNFQHHRAIKIPKKLKQSIKNKRKIIGYFGAIANWFDYELVLKLSQFFPECDICLIGLFNNQLFNQYGLNKQGNIITESPIKHEELFDYARWFDISIIPFIHNEVIACCSPVKLFEYMNIGAPIVTTDIPECRQYKSVLIANTHEEFISLVTKAFNLAKDDKYFQIMKKEAEENTWETRAKVIIDAINKNSKKS
jgi:glycosyltransferase involved in cell wall biosynthesis